jgi:hypothetical protein
MNLTVGPLPPAVYWRRRAVVLGVLAVVVVVFVAMCSSSGESKTNQGSPGTSLTGSPTTSATILTPVIGGSPPSTASPTASPSTVDSGPAQQPTDPGPPPTPCLDTEMSLTVLVHVRAADVELQMKIKNISNRACTRDVGGTPQEIHIATITSKPTDPVVWSSDFCQAANQPADVRTFNPGIESILPPTAVLWHKNYVSAGCTAGNPAPPGTYSVAAKMGTLLSPVVQFTI